MCGSTSTTIRVSKPVRDELGALAAAERVTMDELLRRLARAERQRLMGLELAAHVPSEREQVIAAAGLRTMAVHALRE